MAIDIDQHLRDQMSVGPTVMQVRAEKRANGEPGVWLQIGERPYHFTLAGAKRLRDALSKQIDAASG